MFAAAPPPARASHVCVAPTDVFVTGGPAAHGLLIAGRGPEVSREEALAALDGAQARCQSATVTILLSLPRGKERNDRRYAIAISGPGYDGLLVSDRTRVPGLVSIYDVKPTVQALERGDDAPVTSRRDPRAASHLAELDTRLDDVNDTRTGASLALVALVAGFALLAFARRSPLLGRAALLAVPVVLVTGLVLSALEVSEPWTVVAALLAAGAVGGLATSAVTGSRYRFAAGLLAIFVVYLVVSAVSSETSSLAAIGPRPENGGRFYGFNNQLETLLLAPALLGAALVGVLPVALLALVTVGASFAGADGGGLLVYGSAFAFLWMRLRRVPLTSRNLALAVAAVVVTGLMLVGLDAVLGGESHVTRAVSGGPDQILGDIGDRIAASVRGAVSSWESLLVLGISIPALVFLALRRPRSAVLDALLVGLAVSLVVNDAPREVAGFGALCAGALRFWYESAESVE